MGFIKPNIQSPMLISPLLHLSLLTIHLSTPFTPLQFPKYMATLLHTIPFINTVKLNKNNCHDSISLRNTPYFSINLKDGHMRFRFPAKRNGGTVCAISNSPGNVSPVISEDTPSLLNKVNVFDLNGKAIVISDLWKDRRAVVAFARHFGCVLCRKRADYLATAKDKLDAAGVALVLIGPGRVDQAKVFAEQTNFKGEVYADPDYSSYEALSFVSGIATTFTPKAGLKIIQLYMEGYRQDWGLSFDKDTRTKGGWQQGGIIVAGPGKNNISYVHKDKEAGDDPDIKEILEACCSQ